MEKMTDKQLGFASMKKRFFFFFKQKSTRPQTEEIKGRGKVFVKHSQNSMNCLRQGWRGSNLSGVVRKPHVPSSMAYTLCLIHAHHPHTISTCCQKKPLGWYHTAQVAISAFTFSPPHASLSLFLSFYLNSWYARGRIVIILWCAAPALLQRVARYNKGTGRRPCYAVLRSMLCMLNVVAIMKMQG